MPSTNRYTSLHLAWHWLCWLSIPKPSSALRWVSGPTLQHPSWEWGVECVCVQELFIHMCASTHPLRAPIHVLQLLLSWDPGPAKEEAVGAGAPAFPAHCGLAVKGAASHCGHPALPRGVAATTSVPKCFVSPLRLHTSREPHLDPTLGS